MGDFLLVGVNDSNFCQCFIIGDWTKTMASCLNKDILPVKMLQLLPEVLLWGPSLHGKLFQYRRLVQQTTKTSQ